MWCNFEECVLESNKTICALYCLFPFGRLFLYITSCIIGIRCLFVYNKLKPKAPLDFFPWQPKLSSIIPFYLILNFQYCIINLYLFIFSHTFVLWSHCRARLSGHVTQYTRHKRIFMPVAWNLVMALQVFSQKILAVYLLVNLFCSQVVALFELLPKRLQQILGRMV